MQFYNSIIIIYYYHRHYRDHLLEHVQVHVGHGHQHRHQRGPDVHSHAANKKYLAMVLKIFVTVNISGDQMSTPMLQTGAVLTPCIVGAVALYFYGINKIWGT